MATGQMKPKIKPSKRKKLAKAIVKMMIPMQFGHPCEISEISYEWYCKTLGYVEELLKKWKV